VRAILEHVPAHVAVARDRQERAPLIDRDAGVVGLHEPHAAERAAVELHDVRDAANAVADEPREDPPFALGPRTEVAVAGGEEALGVAAPLAGHHRFAIDLDVVTGRHLQPPAAEYLLDLAGYHGVPCNETGSRGAVSPGAASLSAARPTTAHSASTSPAAVSARANVDGAAALALHDEHRRVVVGRRASARARPA
jgi:hypothetical protein